MSKYKVTIREILEKTIIISADDAAGAVHKASDIVRNEDIVLDADDFSHREYLAEETTETARELMCLQCGRTFLTAADDVSVDELGPHTVCPYCKGSFDVDDEWVEGDPVKFFKGWYRRAHNE